MRFREKIKEYWHDLYYHLANENGVNFAMTCQELTSIIDLGQVPTRMIPRLRFYLHLSLCKACKYYFDGSALLKKAILQFVKKKEKTFDVEKMNQVLVERFSKGRNS